MDCPHSHTELRFNLVKTTGFNWKLGQTNLTFCVTDPVGKFLANRKRKRWGFKLKLSKLNQKIKILYSDFSFQSLLIYLCILEYRKTSFALLILIPVQYRKAVRM